MSSPHAEHEPHKHSPIVLMLERGDGLAHVLVAILLLLLALAILVVSTVSFVHDSTSPPAATTAVAQSSGEESITLSGQPVVVHNGEQSGSPSFAQRGLEYLSDLLLGVIVLELLSTILTYIQARNLEATIKDFLVVALISSIRKILLVGAQSSLGSGSAEDFQREAMGTVVSIIGILLLIGGLLLLDWRMKAKAAAAQSEPVAEGFGELS